MRLHEDTRCQPKVDAVSGELHFTRRAWAPFSPSPCLTLARDVSADSLRVTASLGHRFTRSPLHPLSDSPLHPITAHFDGSHLFALPARRPHPRRGLDAARRA